MRTPTHVQDDVMPILVMAVSNVYVALMFGRMLVGWGVGVVAHGLMAFEVINPKIHKWEKKMIEKKQGSKERSRSTPLKVPDLLDHECVSSYSQGKVMTPPVVV